MKKDQLTNTNNNKKMSVAKNASRGALNLYFTALTIVIQIVLAVAWKGLRSDNVSKALWSTIIGLEMLKGVSTIIPLGIAVANRRDFKAETANIGASTAAVVGSFRAIKGVGSPPEAFSYTFALLILNNLPTAVTQISNGNFKKGTFSALNAAWAITNFLGVRMGLVHGSDKALAASEWACAITAAANLLGAGYEPSKTAVTSTYQFMKRQLGSKETDLEASQNSESSSIDNDDSSRPFECEDETSPLVQPQVINTAPGDFDVDGTLSNNMQ